MMAWRSSLFLPGELKGGALTVKLLSCHMYMTFAHCLYSFVFCAQQKKKKKSITMQC